LLLIRGKVNNIVKTNAELMKSYISNSIEEAIQAIAQLKQPHGLEFIEKAGEMVADAFAQGNKILTAGNGGSLCDAAHLAEEFTGLFRKFRPALPAIVLSDPGHITCTGNDLGFEFIFSRGLEAFGKPNDIFIGLTTSGNSLNMVNAFTAAKKMGLKTISFLGKGGGKLKGVADLELCINGFPTSDRIQEVHMAALHMIIEIVEYRLFPEVCLPELEAYHSSLLR
jgi:D-sedoheptulose 7-phosphate isomerase